MAAVAAGLPIDEDKILFDYKKRFSDIISSNIFSSPAELRSNLALRDSILDYLTKANGGKALIEPAELEGMWTYYINTKFGSKAIFEAKIKEGYLSESDVKERFKDNLVLLRYFKNTVEPRIREDLRKRGETLDYAEKHNTAYESEALKYQFFNTVEEYGGQKRFEKYLQDNYLSVADVFYFIKSDFMTPLIKEDLFKQKLKLDSAYKDALERDISEYYKNHKESKYYSEEKYYIKEIYIAKDSTKLAQQKTELSKLAAELHSSTPPAATLAQAKTLQEPISKSSKLYAEAIKTAVIGKAANYISPLIETKTGFHILIIDKVEPAYYTSLEDAHEQIYSIVKARRLKELEIPVLGQI